jgi:ATP-dependent protease HslVU (ClpYQ) ATPase subunit
MENLWMKAHQFILDSKVGDYYLTGQGKISVVRRSPKRIYFSNGELISIKESKYDFLYFVGKNVDNILRDIEGYFIYKIHSSL